MEPLHGVLDMLVLRTLIFGPLHGYGVAKAIRSSSTDALEIEFGSLYPALKRLEAKGWIVSNGTCPSSTGVRSSTGSPQPAGSGCNRNIRSGATLPPPWRE